MAIVRRVKMSHTRVVKKRTKMMKMRRVKLS